MKSLAVELADKQIKSTEKVFERLVKFLAPFYFFKHQNVDNKII